MRICRCQHGGFGPDLGTFARPLPSHKQHTEMESFGIFVLLSSPNYFVPSLGNHPQPATRSWSLVIAVGSTSPVLICTDYLNNTHTQDIDVSMRNCRHLFDRQTMTAGIWMRTTRTMAVHPAWECFHGERVASISILERSDTLERCDAVPRTCETCIAYQSAGKYGLCFIACQDDCLQPSVCHLCGS